MAEQKLITETIKKHLFEQFDRNVYAVLDGASVPDLPQTLWDLEPENICLYRGELAPDMAQVAPYLVRIEPNSPFTEWVLTKGWGNHWGLFAVTPEEADLRTMRLHFRKFLRVKGPDNKPLYFRYYDPRVLRVYLPTCNKEELKVIFGPILQYILEGEDPATILRCSTEDEKLRTQKQT